jgi:hypothetical protein
MTRHLRLIKGGRNDARQSPVAGSRLYRSYSIGDLTRGEIVYHDVRFNWYCLERDRPLAPFEQLIAGYWQLDARQKTILENEVQRYLTDPEITALQSYVSAKFAMDVAVEPIALPIKERSLFLERGESVIYDFLELSERDDYPLAVKIWGYYTTHKCISSPNLEMGVQFLSKALDMLNIDSKAERHQLESAVKMLYAEHGLLVKQDGTLES